MGYHLFLLVFSASPKLLGIESHTRTLMSAFLSCHELYILLLLYFYILQGGCHHALFTEKKKKKARSSGKESRALALIQITVKCHVALEKNARNQRWTTYYCGCEGRLGMLDIILTFFAAMTWGSSPEIYIMHWLQANSMSTFHMAAQMHTSLSRRFPTSIRWC